MTCGPFNISVLLSPQKWKKNQKEKGFGATYNLILDAICLGPSTHDKSIVESENGNDVYVLVFEAGEVLDVGG